ncbi:MAG: rhomboid family intramembrane serine protease [bacterium]
MAAADSLRRRLPSDCPVTAVILGINVAIFALSLVLDGASATRIGTAFMVGARDVWVATGAFAPAVLAGEWWRLVVPMFVHGGIMHIAFNSMALADLGPAVERTYGSARYLFLYVITGVVGFCATVGWSIVSGVPHLSVGASGAVLGIVGVLLAITVKRGGAYMQMVRSQLLRSIGYTFLLGAVVNVDNAAHLGGLASGFALGMLLADHPPASAGQRNLAVALAAVSALVVVLAFAALVFHVLVHR